VSKFTYQPHIDGLRATAVLSVVIYHLNNSWLAGGFVGVDIFRNFGLFDYKNHY